MKKKIITLSLVLAILFLAFVILTILPQALQAKGDPLPDPDGTYNGQWIYDSGGAHIGCKSPGSDCTWG
jgi:hypothetical protein